MDGPYWNSLKWKLLRGNYCILAWGFNLMIIEKPKWKRYSNLCTINFRIKVHISYITLLLLSVIGTCLVSIPNFQISNLPNKIITNQYLITRMFSNPDGKAHFRNEILALIWDLFFWSSLWKSFEVLRWNNSHILILQCYIHVLVSGVH